MFTSLNSSIRLIVFGVLILLIGIGMLGYTEQAPKHGGTFKIAILPGVSNLDPQATNSQYVFEVSQYAYEKLVNRTAKGGLELQLATSWEVSPDGKTFTIGLRENVAFHDNAPFNAQAVKANFDRRFGENLPMTETLPGYQGTEVVDDYTVKVHFDRPMPPFKPTLALETFSIYSPNALEEGSTWLKTHMVGTGPYKLVEFHRGEKVIFTKNENYWQEGVPYFDRIEIYMIPEDTTRAAMLEAGDVDMATYLQPKDYRRYLDQPDLGIAVRQEPSGGQAVIEPHNQRPPFDNTKVRLAANYAVDKQAIIDQVFYGLAQIAKAPIVTPPVAGYHETGYYPYNPTKAEQLLEEAGWVDTDGDGVRNAVNVENVEKGEEFIVGLWVRAGAGADIDSALMIQQMWKQVGIDANIVVIEAATHRAKVTLPPEEAQYDALYYGFGTYTGDAYDPMSGFWHSNAWAPKYYNRMYYRNEKVDELIDKADECATLEARNELYAQAFEEIYRDPGTIQLIINPVLVAYRDNIRNVIVKPFATIATACFAWRE